MSGIRNEWFTKSESSLRVSNTLVSMNFQYRYCTYRKKDFFDNDSSSNPPKTPHLLLIPLQILKFRLKLLHNIQRLIQMFKRHQLPFPNSKRLSRPSRILDLSPINIPLCQHTNLLRRDGSGSTYF